MLFVFFFFKQKTAYEMRISDWSSDVCSSDLAALQRAARRDELRRPAARAPAVRRPAQTRDPLLQRAAFGETGPDGLGAAALPVRRLGARCRGEAEVRPFLREEPRAAAGPDDPAADGGGGDVQARRAIGRASGPTSWRGHRAASCCCATAAGAASRSPALFRAATR